MFSFFQETYPIIERNVIYEETQRKHPNKFIIVINTYVRNTRLCGDIVAILSPKEYALLEKPASIAPKFGVWRGVALRDERVAELYGVYV